MRPAILSLSRGKEVLMEQNDVLWYLITFSLQNPGETSSLFEDELVSFRKINAKFGGSPAVMADRYEVAMTNLFRRYYPNDAISIVVDHEVSDDSAVYRLILTVSGPNGYILNRGPVEVDGDSVTIKFSK